MIIAGKTILETERLILREFTLNDTGFIVALLNSEGWLKFIGDRNVHSDTDAQNYLTSGPFKYYQELGFGLYGLVLKEDDQLIGMCGLLKRTYLDFPDIGFALLPEYSGKGYAFEIAQATVKYGFGVLGFKRLMAIAAPDNTSSIRLLEKLGFVFEKNILSEDNIDTLSQFYLNPE